MKYFLSSEKIPKSKIQLLFLLCLLVISVINLFVLYPEYKRISAFKTHMKHQIIGHQFIGIKQFVQDEEFIGYITDLDPSEKKGGKLFSAAQYHLAPSILELNNTEHSVLIFKCSSEKVAWQKVKEIGAVPFKRNNFGVILARTN